MDGKDVTDLRLELWGEGYTTKMLLFITTEKERDRERKWDSVGVMKDKEMKLEDVTETPHRLTLGGTSDTYYFYTSIPQKSVNEYLI